MKLLNRWWAVALFVHLIPFAPQLFPCTYPDLGHVQVSVPPSLRPGQTYQMQATLTCADGTLTDISTALTWTLDTGNTITVTPTGLVTALAPGASTIAYNGVGPACLACVIGVKVDGFFPKFVFAADDCVTVSDCTEGSVSVFTVDALKGALTLVPGSPFPSGGQDAVSVAPHPTLNLAFVLNEFLSATNQATGGIQIFLVDPTSGALTPVGGLTPTGGYNPYTITTTPNGNFVLVANQCVTISNCSHGSVTVFPFDRVNTALKAPVGTYPTGGRAVYVTVDQSGTLVFTSNYVDNNFGSVNVFLMDPNTGALTQAGPPVSVAGYLHGRVAVDPVSTRFAYIPSGCILNGAVCASKASIYAYEINKLAGALIPVPGSPFVLPDTASYSAILDPAGRFLYADNGYLQKSIVAASVSPSTGALTQNVAGSPIPTGSNQVYSLMTETSGKFVFGATAVDRTHYGVAAFTRDSATGALTQVAGSPYSHPLYSLEQIAVMGQWGSPYVVGLSLPASVSLQYGQTWQYTVAAKANDNTYQFLTNSVTWTTSNSGVAQIAPSGLLTTTGPGTATIQACVLNPTPELICASSLVNVYAIRLTTGVYPANAGVISPSITWFAPGASATVTATANPGYVFSDFSGSLNGTTNPQTLTLNGDSFVTANFAPVRPSITAWIGVRTDGSAAGTRNVPISLLNSGTVTATNATISSVSGVTVLAGTGPVSVASPSSVDLGAIGTGQSSTGTLVFNWPATATRVRFTVNFTADGGYSGSTVITTFR